MSSEVEPVRENGVLKDIYTRKCLRTLLRVEDRVARVYRKLLAGEVLTAVERLIWSRWILCQFSRTPSHILELAGLEEDVLASFPGFAYDFSSAEIQAKIDIITSNVLDFQNSEQLIPFIILTGLWPW